MDCSVSPLGFHEKFEGFYSSSINGKPSQRRGNWFPTSTPIQPIPYDSGYHSTPQHRDRLNSVKRRCSFVEEETEGDEIAFLEECFETGSSDKRFHQTPILNDSEKCKYLDKFQDDLLSSIEVDDFYSSMILEKDIRLYLDSSYANNSNNKTCELTTNYSKDQEFHTYDESVLSSPNQVLCSNTKSQETKDHEFVLDLAADFNLSTKSAFAHSKIIENVDFITEFRKRNCYPVLNTIFSYLSPKDLLTASSINQTWRTAVLGHKSARRRRSVYLKEKRHASTGPHKENLHLQKANDSIHTGILKEIQNVDLSKSSLSITNPENVSLLQVSLVSEPEVKLLKCPKCSSPTRINSAGSKSICTKASCMHEFCSKCCAPHTGMHSCSFTSSQETSSNQYGMCSKKSRRNLRRL